MSWRKRIDRAAIAYNLSPRQKEVVILLAKGRTAKYISKIQCISYSTAKSHVYTVYRKMGVHSQQELIDSIESIMNGK
jgi:DNA-binding CsgD family transcriptional regulator